MIPPLLRRIRNDLPMRVTLRNLGDCAPPSKFFEGHFRFLRPLKEKLGPQRILLDDDQRRRLAVKGKVLGRKLLGEIGTLFTPDTILRWHRTLVAVSDHSELTH